MKVCMLIKDDLMKVISSVLCMNDMQVIYSCLDDKNI